QHDLQLPRPGEDRLVPRALRLRVVRERGGEASRRGRPLPRPIARAARVQVLAVLGHARVRRPARALPRVPERRVTAPAQKGGAPEVRGAVKALLEASTDAAVVLDEERRIVYYNRAYQLASGNRGRALAAAADAGARCHEIFPLDVCETACVGCRALASGRPLRVELVGAVRGDGEALTLAVTAAPIQDDHGGTLIVETYRDITADVRIQRKYKVLLNAAADELPRTQAQLIHQEKKSSLGG